MGEGGCPQVDPSRFPGGVTPHGDSGRAAATLLVALTCVAVFALLVPAVVVVGAAADCSTTDAAGAALAEQEIPANYLELYRQAAAEHGLRWPVLAAIGWVETRHGTLNAAGVASGSNSSGAAGPMQFGIGGRAGNTWAVNPCGSRLP